MTVWKTGKNGEILNPGTVAAADGKLRILLEQQHVKDAGEFAVIVAGTQGNRERVDTHSETMATKGLLGGPKEIVAGDAHNPPNEREPTHGTLQPAGHGQEETSLTR
jgi:hypothetical protein